MIDWKYKSRRIARWRQTLGLFEALKFELAWSLRFKHVGIAVPGYPNPFVLRNRTSDISVFETVFIEQEFCGYLPGNLEFVIDGGANIGLSTAFYAYHYPNALVLAVEPSNTNCKILRKNCFSFENVVVIEGGIWGQSGTLRLANPGSPLWALRFEETSRAAQDTVPAYSIQDLFKIAKKDRCNLLKLDVEGAEKNIFLSQFDAWLPYVDAILIEIHGNAAKNIIKHACPESSYNYRNIGEKLLITPA